MSEDELKSMLDDWKDYKVADFAFRVMLTRSLEAYETSPIHVKAARMLEERGYEVRKGDYIDYVITNDGVCPLQFASMDDINWEKYREYFKSMMAPILDVLDLDYDEIVTGIKQLRLDEISYTDENEVNE